MATWLLQHRTRTRSRASPMRELVTLPDGTAVTLYYGSRLARALGGRTAINNCVVLSATGILVSQDWITARGLAHEVGHVMQARARGWYYLPWVLYQLLFHGYAGSAAEQRADVYMTEHAAEFTAHGVVPPQYS